MADQQKDNSAVAIVAILVIGALAAGVIFLYMQGYFAGPAANPSAGGSSTSVQINQDSGDEKAAPAAGGNTAPAGDSGDSGGSPGDTPAN